MPYERDHHIYCMSKTYWPILYSKLLNKMGQDILYIRYILFCSLKYSYWTVYNNLSFLLQHAALRTTLEVCLSACLHVCLHVCVSTLDFLPFTQIFGQPIPQNLWPYAIFFADAPLKKMKNLVCEGVHHFLDTKYKIFCLL